MSKEEQNKIKLMILFMIKKAQFRLSNSQILPFFQEHSISDYFSIQNLLSELVETKLLDVAKSKLKSLYSLTDEGHECISFFEKELGSVITEQIVKYLEDNKIKMREESNCIADFVEGKERSYDVNLELLEGKESLFSLKLNVPDAETARLICENWKESSQSIYKFTMKKLLS